MCSTAVDLGMDFLQCLHVMSSSGSSMGRPVGKVALSSGSMSLTRGESGEALRVIFVSI